MNPNDISHQPPIQANQPIADAQPVTPVVDVALLFNQIAEKIIEQQEAVIGPIAVEQAKQIRELSINWPQHHVGVSGNAQQAIDELVEKYKELFGQIAVQASRDAVANILPQLPSDQQPRSLVV